MTAVVAILGLAVLLGMVFLADALPQPSARRYGGVIPAATARSGRSLTVKVTGPGNSLKAGSSPRGLSPWQARILGTRHRGHGRFGHRIAIVVLAIPAGKMIGIMDDTVDWGSTPAATADPQPPGPQADRGRDQSPQIR